MAVRTKFTHRILSSLRSNKNYMTEEGKQDQGHKIINLLAK